MEESVGTPDCCRRLGPWSGSASPLGTAAEGRTRAGDANQLPRRASASATRLRGSARGIPGAPACLRVMGKAGQRTGLGCHFSHMIDTEIASFDDGDSRAGALISHCSEDLIRTTLVFKVLDGPIIHLFEQTRFRSDVMEWSANMYVDHLENSVVEVRPDASPWRPDLPENPIPSYAAHLVRVR